MPKMTDIELRALLDAEKSDALSANQASTLTADRQKAMNYYMGDVSQDIPDMDGRSKAVSSDVSDTIEGLMPTLMEIFCGGDDVVQFTPVGQEDVQAAQQETDYVNHVFMQKNPGFLILYSFIKDSLLSKVGIVKLWTEEDEREERETFLDQPDGAFAMLAAHPDLEIVEHTEHQADLNGTPITLHDATVIKRKTVKRHKIEVVPPEEFGISRWARNIRDCGYCFHEVKRRQSDLIAKGYDEDQVRGLPAYASTAQNAEVTARDSVDESQAGQGSTGVNEALRQILVTEHHIRMDYEGNGKAKLYRVTTGGPQGAILKRGGKEEILEENRVPMAAMTPVIITHRFVGRSIADLVMDIQRIKTALMRALLDNTYMAVNPRPEVAETLAHDNTLDDLLQMRPGMPIRVKQPGAINWQQVPFVGSEVLPVIQFMDATREWRTGVSRQGQGVDANALQNQVATIANQMYDAAQQKVKLIARIFAETGMRDLFSLLHAEIRENGDVAETVRLRNTWVNVDPSEWKERDDMTINVGLGTGSKSQQLAHVMAIIGLQEKALAGGMTTLVTPKNLYNAAREATRLIGQPDVDTFFTDPTKPPDPSNPPLPPHTDPKAAQAQQELQMQAQAQQADQQLAVQKHQFDVQLATAKAQADTQLEMTKLDKEYQLKATQLAAEYQLKEQQFAAEMALRREQMEHEVAIKYQAAQSKTALDSVRFGGEVG